MKAGLLLLTWVWVVDIASHLFYHFLAPKVVVWLLSCVLLHWDPMNCSLPNSSGHGIFPGKILEWVGISSSRGSSGLRDWTCVSGVSCSGRRFFTHYVTWEAWKMSGAVKTRGICRDHLEELKEQLPKTEAKWGFLPMSYRWKKRHHTYQVSRHHVTTANSVDESWQLE